MDLRRRCWRVIELEERALFGNMKSVTGFRQFMLIRSPTTKRKIALQLKKVGSSPTG
jgi:hypothetical protein